MRKAIASREEKEQLKEELGEDEGGDMDRKELVEYKRKIKKSRNARRSIRKKLKKN